MAPSSSWAAPQSQISLMPPPPPIPNPVAPSSMPYGAGSITSPTYTGTDVSGSYANNRRRRRAERARTRQERQQAHGVEFT
ncbi:Cytochrome b561/ferric reductase transmembrane [Penicillium nucicola]|uniref:Cytochrome b561/ferric reductase transmembrane n=1 Tax=Penicillium nucicola TaxID=1850975 RepID=UPI002545049E|nr:Cytochrome b561/ferric reductase transmembrane [Penicillium nucicola]KAJ5758270.1 Cytochrome b561/ferric reductase transmembrane [Penicillium nucicola]